MFDVNSGDSIELTVRLYSGETQIAKASMSALTMSLRDVRTGGTINSRSAVDLMSATASDGTITIALISNDSIIVDKRLATEEHQILVRCTYSGGKVGSAVITLRVINTAKLP